MLYASVRKEGISLNNGVQRSRCVRASTRNGPSDTRTKQIYASLLEERKSVSHILLPSKEYDFRITVDIPFQSRLISSPILLQGARVAPAAERVGSKQSLIEYHGERRGSRRKQAYNVIFRVDIAGGVL